MRWHTAFFGIIIKHLVSKELSIAIYVLGVLAGTRLYEKLSQVGLWWLRNHCTLDLKLRLNKKKDLWADSHKYWNYVFMHFTISDFESTTSSASYWIKCFSNNFIVFTTKLARLEKLGRALSSKKSTSGWCFMVSKQINGSLKMLN